LIKLREKPARARNLVPALWRGQRAALEASALGCIHRALNKIINYLAFQRPQSPEVIRVAQEMFFHFDTFFFSRRAQQVAGHQLFFILMLCRHISRVMAQSPPEMASPARG
jgi:hypothetical protein